MERRVFFCKKQMGGRQLLHLKGKKVFGKRGKSERNPNRKGRTNSLSRKEGLIGGRDNKSLI